VKLYGDDETRHPDSGYDPARVAQYRQQMRVVERANRLAELRVSRRLNQTDLGRQIGVGQRTVSKIENGDIEHSRVETLRKYVEALGGEVEIVARFGDEAYTIA
jgi:DNA-binding XRE family transcriptional regulator